MVPAAASVKSIVRYDDAPTRQQLLSALTLTVVLWGLLIGAGAIVTVPSETYTHAPHSIMSSATDGAATAMDHPHIQGPVEVCRDIFVDVVLPRAATVLLLVGISVAIVALAVFGNRWSWTAVRGPPPFHDIFVSGRKLLLRLCIARR